ncbi:MAG: hypothetical protein KAS32_29650 [Candidatus Peribacteraceae bacterium]|nr:hypothetical protein [Candidatus Peribacteraceae bacterium]
MKTNKYTLNFREHRLIFDGLEHSEPQVQNLGDDAEPPVPMTQEELEAVALDVVDRQVVLGASEIPSQESDNEAAELLFNDQTDTEPELIGSEPEDTNATSSEATDKDKKGLAKKIKEEKYVEKKSYEQLIKEGILNFFKKLNEFLDNFMKNLAEGFGQVKEMVNKKPKASDSLDNQLKEIDAQLKEQREKLGTLDPKKDSEAITTLKESIKKLGERHKEIKAEKKEKEKKEKEKEKDNLKKKYNNELESKGLLPYDIHISDDGILEIVYEANEEGKINEFRNALDRKKIQNTEIKTTEDNKEIVIFSINMNGNETRVTIK